MKTTISENNFRDAFSIRKDNFSYEGLTALYDYLTQYEEDCGVELELDPIAICCDFTEFEDLAEFREQYGKDKDFTIEDLHDETTVIPVEGTDKFIIQDY